MYGGWSTLEHTLFPIVNLEQFLLYGTGVTEYPVGSPYRCRPSRSKYKTRKKRRPQHRRFFGVGFLRWRLVERVQGPGYHGRCRYNVTMGQDKNAPHCAAGAPEVQATQYVLWWWSFR